MDTTKNVGNIEYLGEFPSPQNDPKIKKTESYGVAWASSIWRSAEKSTYSVAFDNDYERIKENVKFARGEHSIDQFKSRAIPSETEYITIDYSVSTPLPKMLRITRQNIYNHPYKPQVKPYDSIVETKYEEEKNKVLGRMVIANQIDELVSSGVVPEEIKLDNRISSSPRDQKEAKAYLDTTFQVMEAIALEKIIRHGFDANNMPSIEKKMVRDLVENATIAVKAYADENQEFKIEHLDLLDIITSYCEMDDFSDMTHVGARKFITVGEFRERMSGRIGEQEIFEIAKQNIGNRVNKTGDFRFPNKNYFHELTNSERRAIESVMIELFDFECLESDKTTYKEKELDTGGFDFSKKSADYKGTSPKTKSVSGYIEKIYAGTWVVDTNYMLEWGMKPNVIRKIRNGVYKEKPCFSYILRKPNMIEMKNSSMCEEVIPHIEQMIVYSIKLQHFVAVSNPPGYIIDIAALVAALPGMGMDNYKPSDAAEITRVLGNAYYSSITEDGEQLINQTPVRYNPTNLGDGVLALVELYNVELAKVKDILGLNQSVDASQPDERTAVAAQQMAFTAHKSSIKEYQDAYLEVVDEVAERAAYVGQMAIQSNKEPEYIKQLLSAPEFKALEMKDVGELMFNTEIKMLPDSQQKRSMIEKVGFAVQQGTLDVDAAIMLENLIEEDLDKAQVMFSRYKEDLAEKKKIEAQEASQMIIQQQQAKAQAEAQKEQLSSQYKLQEIQAEKDLELRNEKEREEERRKTEAVILDGKKELLRLQADLEFKYGKDDKKEDSPNRTAPPSPKTDVTT